MVNIIKEEVVIEESLKKKITLICEFAKTIPTFINGSIRRIDKINLTYLEPHRIIIKDITFLIFNYSNIKKEQEKYKKKLNELNSKTDKLQNESVKITNIIDELKPSKLNKDNLIISTKQVDEIKKYINNTKKQPLI